MVQAKAVFDSFAEKGPGKAEGLTVRRLYIRYTCEANKYSSAFKDGPADTCCKKVGCNWRTKALGEVLLEMGQMRIYRRLWDSLNWYSLRRREWAHRAQQAKNFATDEDLLREQRLPLSLKT